MATHTADSLVSFNTEPYYKQVLVFKTPAQMQQYIVWLDYSMVAVLQKPSIFKNVVCVCQFYSLLLSHKLTYYFSRKK